MISNVEYDLSRPLATALRAKAPFVGVPIPGHAPLVFDRLKLARALNGVKPVDIQVEIIPHSRIRLLCVEGVAGPRVRTRLRMAALDPAWHRTPEGRKAMGKWRDAEQRAQQRMGAKKPARGTTQAVTVYRKLQRELEKMRQEHKLYNPCCPIGRGPNYHNTEEYLSERKGAKRKRTLVGALAKTYSHEESRKLYAEMTRRGWTFTKYSDVRQPDKERYASTYPSYLRNLWRFVLGTGSQYFLGCRSYSQPPEMRDPESMKRVWGPARYFEKIEDMRARQSLRSQIEAIATQFPIVPKLARLEDLQRDLKTVQSGRWYRVGRKPVEIQAEINTLNDVLITYRAVFS